MNIHIANAFFILTTALFLLSVYPIIFFSDYNEIELYIRVGEKTVEGSWNSRWYPPSVPRAFLFSGWWRDGYLLPPNDEK
ncbi:MAG TPA: hypothetical protein VN379_06825 [Sporomusa sp.]|nr:hypothetical protein [Sporomusa sp.]